MNFKARFERKENTPDVSEADIVGVTELSREQYSRFYGQMLNDYDFIADYANETYDDGERKHCLLVLGEGEELVNENVLEVVVLCLILLVDLGQCDLILFLRLTGLDSACEQLLVDNDTAK